MEAVLGSEMPFVKACVPMKLLAGLDVPAKAIERAAESIGTEVAAREQREIERAKQLALPIISKQNIARMYVLLDGVTGPRRARRNRGPGRQNRGTARPYT